MGHPQPKYRNSAAFYDVDGTLIKTNIVHAFAFYASRKASMIESAVSTLKTAFQVPAFWAADKVSRKWFNEIFYRSYQGEGEDRLVCLAEDLFEDVINHRLRNDARTASGSGHLCNNNPACTNASEHRPPGGVVKNRRPAAA